MGVRKPVFSPGFDDFVPKGSVMVRDHLLAFKGKCVDLLLFKQFGLKLKVVVFKTNADDSKSCGSESVCFEDTEFKFLIQGKGLLLAF